MTIGRTGKEFFAASILEIAADEASFDWAFNRFARPIQPRQRSYPSRREEFELPQSPRSSGLLAERTSDAR